MGIRETSLTWGPLSGAYGEEVYQNHRFRWLDSPAEIVIWAPTAENVSVEGEWRCGFHVSEANLEVLINGRAFTSARLTQNTQRIVWPSVPLKAGQNVLHFSSSAGHARISEQDPRVIGMGLQDLQIRQKQPAFNGEIFRFFLGLGAIIFIGRRISRLLQLRGVDALGVGLLGAFAAISLSATILSFFQGLTGTTWIVSLLGIALFLALFKTASPTRVPDSFKWTHIGLLLLPVIYVGTVQLLSPVTKFDDLMYHGSRAGYWLGNHSALPFLSHNERQEVFPYPGDLLFAFGVFTAHSETLGKIVTFLAYPSVLLLNGGMLLQRGASARLAVGTAWAIGTTPRLSEAAIGIKPDLWGLVFSLIALNATWNIGWEPQGEGRKLNSLIVLGSIVAAVAIKPTFLLLLPLSFVPLFFATSVKERIHYVLATTAWLFAFGLITTVAHNEKHENGWWGSPAMTAVHRPDSGVGAVKRHLCRLPFVVLGVPWIPSEPLRLQIEETLSNVAHRIGATTPLPSENNQGWPGIFSVKVPEYNREYSLLWLMGLIGLGVGLLKRKRAHSPRTMRAGVAIVGSGLALAIGVTCAVRWQSISDIPARFLIPGMAIATIGAAWCWHGNDDNRSITGYLLATLLLVHAIPFLHDCWLFTLQVKEGGLATGRADSVLSPAAAVIPPNSRILLFASQSSGDYVLFHPESGFQTRVFPWGRAPFSEERLASVLAADNPDFVVFEQPDWVSFHWHEPLNLKLFVGYFEKSSLFSREPMGAPNLIYKRSGYSQ